LPFGAVAAVLRNGMFRRPSSRRRPTRCSARDSSSLTTPRRRRPRPGVRESWA